MRLQSAFPSDWMVYRVLHYFTRFRKVVLFFALLSTVLCLYVYVRPTHANNPAVQRADNQAEKLPLFRDLYEQEVWKDISRDDSLTPKQVPGTVHFLWCGSKQFRFQHYLSVLSAIRLLQPLKIVFHYSQLPVVDKLWYNVWFLELKQSYANLELTPLGSSDACGAGQRLQTVLGFLSSNGGIYIGENVILTRISTDIVQRSFWFAISGTLSNVTTGLIFANGGFDVRTRQENMFRDFSSNADCRSVEDYNQAGLLTTPPCVVLTNNVHPKDIWSDNTPFAELARWLYYGKRQTLQVQPSSNSSIPRIAHMTWLNRDGTHKKNGAPFLFYHFVCILSSLHVAKMRHVYVHGDQEPEGEWWERLRGENVTFVPIDTPRRVFQQWVGSPTHRSDIIRVHILQAYGGVYHDRDVMWVNPIPDWLLRYPTVVCPDWPLRGEWPAAFNMGILMAQAQAPWLRHFLSTLRLFLDYSWAYNAIMTPYKVYERHPDTLYVDKHLQVICYKGNCHPTWHDDYIRDIHDPRPPRDFDWLEARSFHFTVPKPPELRSLASPEDVRKGTDLFAKIGRHILMAAGRGALINER